MTESRNPYQGLPAERFWRNGVGNSTAHDIPGLYRKKFALSAEDRIATGGSCFAQHIARNMVRNGYSVLDVEPAPPGLSPKLQKEFGYGIYSARYGNIYTTRHLLQLAKESLGLQPIEPVVWERDGRYFDAFRPAVEPDGLDSPEEVAALRAAHLVRVAEMLTTMTVFVFTFGLTEGWVSRDGRLTFPLAPGVVAGTFDDAQHAFHNFTSEEIHADFTEFMEIVRGVNPGVRYIVTVSPVPLTATAADRHILLSNVYSKSVLRGVAGRLADEHAEVDYFPSYEIITSPMSRGVFYEPNMRSVSPAGVETVMDVFFAAHHRPERPPGPARRPAPNGRSPGRRGAGKRDVVCEEALLEAFSHGG